MTGEVRVRETTQIEIIVSGGGVHMWKFSKEDAAIIYAALKDYFGQNDE